MGELDKIISAGLTTLETAYDVASAAAKTSLKAIIMPPIIAMPGSWSFSIVFAIS